MYVCMYVCVYVLQGPQHPEICSVYVDQRALRMDRVVVLERGAPHSMSLMEGGKILPDVRVTIVHPDTKVPCAHTDLGEVHLCVCVCVRACVSYSQCSIIQMCIMRHSICLPFGTVIQK